MENDEKEYLNYDEYSGILLKHNIEFIPCIKKYTNPTHEDFLHCLTINNYLIEDGKGTGEGIVIKNYDYTNKFGKKVWAKFVKTKFKDKMLSENKQVSIDHKPIELDFANTLDADLVNKVKAKIVNECDGWESKYISRLLQTVYYDFINEELWDLIKKKNPVVNFSQLRRYITARTKELLPEVF